MTLTSDGSESLTVELLAANDTALSALLEVTPIKTVGAQTENQVVDENTVTLFYDCLMQGYPGWRWAVTLSKVSREAHITVTEVNLLPGENSLIAPEWIPWADRLAAFRQAQKLQLELEAEQAEAAAEELADVDDIDPAEDLLENDFSDFDDELDGVDVDLLADMEFPEPEEESPEAPGGDDLDPL